MKKNTAGLLGARLKAILGGVLVLSLVTWESQAGESSGNRYDCIAKIKGRYFTNGSAWLKEYPCRVAPAEVDGLVKIREADEKTDQINFDYHWGQEYYIAGRTLTDIQEIPAREAGSGRSISFVYADICRKGNLEETGALSKMKEAFGYKTEPDAAVVAGQIYAVCKPFNKAHYEHAIVEQSAENKDQILLYGSTAGADDKKFMGAVAWAPPAAEVEPIQDDIAELESMNSGLIAAAVQESPAPAAAQTDPDGDGVPDTIDMCPATPAGSMVDAAGCIPDADSDGVSDPADKCPGTSAGSAVDAAGCVPGADSDGDGVPDSLDGCPATPARIVVDAKGCFPGSDSDDDGVPDTSDFCPATPARIVVDAEGCFPGADRIPRLP